MDHVQCLVGMALLLVPSFMLLNTACFTFLLMFLQLKGGQMPQGNTSYMPSVQDYFPHIKSDLSLIKWGHGINSKRLLQKSLDGKLIF